MRVCVGVVHTVCVCSTREAGGGGEERGVEPYTLYYCLFIALDFVHLCTEL